MYDRNVKSEHILTKLRVLDYECACDRIDPLELHLTTSELWFGQEQEGILP